MKGFLTPDGSLAEGELRELKDVWWLLFGLGAVQIVLGLFAVSYAAIATTAVMIYFGCILLVGGGGELAQAFYTKSSRGFLVDLLSGLLYVVLGFLLIAAPVKSAAVLSLLLALALLFGGLFRVAAAVSIRAPHWGWVLIHGFVCVVLGLAIWKRWPWSGLWVIGVFVGIDLMFRGWSMIVLGYFAKGISDPGADQSAAAQSSEQAPAPSP